MKLIYLLLSAIFYNLSYSPFDYKILIFISFVILFITINDLSLKKKSVYLFLYAFLAHMIGVSWVSQSLINYSPLGHVGSFFITLVFVVLISIPYALIGLLHRSIKENTPLNINLLAALFVFIEFIKSFAFGGFPWLLVGHTQTGTIFNIIYPYLGSYGVSYFVVVLSGIVSVAYLKTSKNLSFISVVFLLMYLLTPNNSFYDKHDNKEHISFTIYQPNIYPDLAYDSKEYNKIIDKYRTFLDNNNMTDLVIFPETILSTTLEKDNPSIDERYERAIANFRYGNSDAAMRNIQSLLLAEPENPYFYELGGEIAFADQNLPSAIEYLTAAFEKSQQAPLIGMRLGRALSATGITENYVRARDILKIAVAGEPDWPFVRREYAIALGKTGDIATANWQLAEVAFLNGDLQQANSQLKRALEQPNVSPELKKQLIDLKFLIENAQILKAH